MCLSSSRFLRFRYRYVVICATLSLAWAVQIRRRTLRGLIEVPLVHCTYLVKMDPRYSHKLTYSIAGREDLKDLGTRSFRLRMKVQVLSI